MTEFSMVIQVGEKHIARGQLRPYPKSGDSVPQKFWDHTYAQTVSPIERRNLVR